MHSLPSFLLVLLVLLPTAASKRHILAPRRDLEAAQSPAPTLARAPATILIAPANAPGSAPGSSAPALVGFVGWPVGIQVG